MTLLLERKALIRTQSKEKKKRTLLFLSRANTLSILISCALLSLQRREEEEPIDTLMKGTVGSDTLKGGIRKRLTWKPTLNMLAARD